MTITSEIKESFKSGNMLTKLIYINIGVFLLANIFFIIFALSNRMGMGFADQRNYFSMKFLTYLMVPADFSSLITKPWTLITYMFLHFDFLHILFNMLWFYWFGRLFLMHLSGRQLFSTYVMGGLSGAFLFIIAYNVFPGLSLYVKDAQALGASAAIVAIIVAISFYIPNHEVVLIFIGPVKVKYIAIFFIATDILYIAFSPLNTGGHIAHIGGAIYGYWFITRYKKGKDIGRGVDAIMDFIATAFKPRRNLRVSYKRDAKNMDDMEYNASKAQMQEEIDRILDKIAKSGYDSLSKKEKETLFKMGGKN